MQKIYISLCIFTFIAFFLSSNLISTSITTAASTIHQFRHTNFLREVFKRQIESTQVKKEESRPKPGKTNGNFASKLINVFLR